MGSELESVYCGTKGNYVGGSSLCEGLILTGMEAAR